MNIEQAQVEFDDTYVRLIEAADEPGQVASLALMRVVETYLQFGRSFDDIDRMIMDFLAEMRKDPRHQTP